MAENTVRLFLADIWSQATSFVSGSINFIHSSILQHRASKWIARQLGWGLVAAGIAVAQWDEYGAALVLFVSGCFVLLIRGFHWTGINRWPKTTSILRWVWIMTAAFGMVASWPITVAKKGDKPWSALFQRMTPKSVLAMHAFPTGTYGPTKQMVDVDMDIHNPSEDAIQNLDLIIKVVSPHLIRSISQLPTDADACRFNPVPLPDSRVVIGGLSERDHITLDSQDMLTGLNYFFRWRLECPRIGSHSTVRVQLTTVGDSENDAIQAIGDYERIPSKGSTVVKIKEIIPINRA